MSHALSKVSGTSNEFDLALTGAAAAFLCAKVLAAGTIRRLLHDSSQMLLSIHLLNFFLRLGAPTATLTLVITVARSIDLLSDPAVGWATDGNVLRMCGPCKFPRGVRRKPFMLLGAPFYNLFIVMLLGTPFEFEGAGWGEQRPACGTVGHFAPTGSATEVDALSHTMRGPRINFTTSPIAQRACLATQTPPPLIKQACPALFPRPPLFAQRCLTDSSISCCTSLTR